MFYEPTRDMHRVQTSVNQRKRDTESQSDRWSAGNIGTQCQWKQQFRAKCVSLIQSTECCFRVQGLTHTHKMGTKGVQENTLARDASHWLTYSPSRYCTRGNNLSILKYKIFTFTQPKWCVWMENRSELFTKLATLVFALARLYPLFITELSWLFVSVSYFPYYNEISASFYHIFRLFRLFSAISIS